MPSAAAENRTSWCWARASTCSQWPVNTAEERGIGRALLRLLPANNPFSLIRGFPLDCRPLTRSLTLATDSRKEQCSPSSPLSARAPSFLSFRRDTVMSLMSLLSTRGPPSAGLSCRCLSTRLGFFGKQGLGFSLSLLLSPIADRLGRSDSERCDTVVVVCGDAHGEPPKPAPGTGGPCWRHVLVLRVCSTPTSLAPSPSLLLSLRLAVSLKMCRKVGCTTYVFS